MVFPLFSGALLCFGVNYLSVKQSSKLWSPFLALTLSLFVSFIGILRPGQLWGVDAIRYLFWSPFLAGSGGALVTLLTVNSEHQRVSKLLKSSVPLILVILTTYMLSAPLQGIWRDGVNEGLLNEFLIPGSALAMELTM